MKKGWRKKICDLIKIRKIPVVEPVSQIAPMHSHTPLSLCICAEGGGEGSAKHTVKVNNRLISARKPCIQFGDDHLFSVLNPLPDVIPSLTF